VKLATIQLEIETNTNVQHEAIKLESNTQVRRERVERKSRTMRAIKPDWNTHVEGRGRGEQGGHQSGVLGKE
jgi:hypothetical protein